MYLKPPTEAYPLTWPMGRPRTTRRESARFNTSLDKAIRNVQDEVRAAREALLQ